MNPLMLAIMMSGGRTLHPCWIMRGWRIAYLWVCGGLYGAIREFKVLYFDIGAWCEWVCGIWWDAYVA